VTSRRNWEELVGTEDRAKGVNLSTIGSSYKNGTQNLEMGEWLNKDFEKTTKNVSPYTQGVDVDRLIEKYIGPKEVKRGSVTDITQPIWTQDDLEMFCKRHVDKNISVEAPKGDRIDPSLMLFGLANKANETPNSQISTAKNYSKPNFSLRHQSLGDIPDITLTSPNESKDNYYSSISKNDWKFRQKNIAKWLQKKKKDKSKRKATSISMIPDTQNKSAKNLYSIRRPYAEYSLKENVENTHSYLTNLKAKKVSNRSSYFDVLMDSNIKPGSRLSNQAPTFAVDGYR
jgi:hypothetical protein